MQIQFPGLMAVEERETNVIEIHRGYNKVLP
jgi:hypothetical protein